MTKLIAFVGYANSGKTTLITALLLEFVRRGIKVAAVKHDSHGHAVARSETADTGKFLSAGAVASLLVSPGQVQISMPADPAPEDIARYLPPADVILVEGFKGSRLPKIVVLKEKSDTELLTRLQNVRAVVAPFTPTGSFTHFYPNEIAGIADYILEYNTP